MNKSLTLTTIALIVFGFADTGRSESATTVEWLSDQAVAYLDDDTRLSLRDAETETWEIETGTVRIACSSPVQLTARGRTLVVEDGLATIVVHGLRVESCVEEGSLLIEDHRVTAGECAVLDSSGQLSTVQRTAVDTGSLQPPSIDLHPATLDDPWLSLERVLGSLGLESTDASDQGENVEAGGAAACLDSSSSGVDTGGTETPELVVPEVDRDGHIVHVEITLEDF